MNNETTAHIVQTPNYPNLAYGQPIAPPAPPDPKIVIVNQKDPDSSHIPGPKDFMIDPITFKCPFCGKMMATEVTKDINICACLFCYCTGLIFYISIQACRGKSLCCWNAVHRCPFCHNVVGHYSAC